MQPEFLPPLTKHTISSIIEPIINTKKKVKSNTMVMLMIVMATTPTNSAIIPSIIVPMVPTSKQLSSLRRHLDRTLASELPVREKSTSKANSTNMAIARATQIAKVTVIRPRPNRSATTPARIIAAIIDIQQLIPVSRILIPLSIFSGIVPVLYNMKQTRYCHKNLGQVEYNLYIML